MRTFRPDAEERDHTHSMTAPNALSVAKPALTWLNGQIPQAVKQIGTTDSR